MSQQWQSFQTQTQTRTTTATMTRSTTAMQTSNQCVEVSDSLGRTFDSPDRAQRWRQHQGPHQSLLTLTHIGEKRNRSDDDLWTAPAQLPPDLSDETNITTDNANSDDDNCDDANNKDNNDKPLPIWARHGRLSRHNKRPTPPTPDPATPTPKGDKRNRSDDDLWAAPAQSPPASNYQTANSRHNNNNKTNNVCRFIWIENNLAHEYYIDLRN